jgi:hypothetical protein
MNRNRLANGSEIERRKQAEGHGHPIGRARRPTSRGGMRSAVPPYACCARKGSDLRWFTPPREFNSAEQPPTSFLIPA